MQLDGTATAGEAHKALRGSEGCECLEHSSPEDSLQCEFAGEEIDDGNIGISFASAKIGYF